MRVFRLVTVNSVEERILARAHYKLGLDKKIIEAGMFNKKSNAKERKSMLEEIMRQEEESKDQDEEDIPSDKQINEMLARSNQEYELFQKMDKERAEKDRLEAKRMGLKEPPPRLMSDEELPAWLRVEHIEFEEDPTIYGRGHRRRAAPVSYDDGLTEGQWEKLLEEGGDEDDIAEMREKNSARRAKRMAEVLDDNPDEQLELQPRKRTRREVAPPPPPPRGRDKKQVRKASANQEKMKRIWDAIATSREPETGRQRSKLFMRLPSKKLYPDYFEIIKKPISLNNIKANIEKSGYTAQLFKDEFNLIFDNAQHYNIPDSEVYQDAVFLQKLFAGHWEQNFGSGAQADNSDEENEIEDGENNKKADKLDDIRTEDEPEVNSHRGKRKSSSSKNKKEKASTKGKRNSTKGSNKKEKTVSMRKRQKEAAETRPSDEVDETNGDTIAVFGDEPADMKRSSGQAKPSSAQKLTIRLKAPAQERKRRKPSPEPEDEGEVLAVEEEIVEEVIEEEIVEEEVIDEDDEYDADQVDLDLDE